MKFVQLIEFQTSRIDELTALLDEWSASVEGLSDVPSRVMLCADRDRPGTYVHIVEFASYDAAMTNSARPATAEFAERLGKLTDGETLFRNLDLSREM